MRFSSITRLFSSFVQWNPRLIPFVFDFKQKIRNLNCFVFQPCFHSNRQSQKVVCHPFESSSSLDRLSSFRLLSSISVIENTLLMRLKKASFIELLLFKEMTF